MKTPTMLFFAVGILCTGSALADCSADDTIMLAKQGYTKIEIKALCKAKAEGNGGANGGTQTGSKGSPKGTGKHAGKDTTESRRIAEKLSRVFGAQFALTEKGNYSRAEINKSTSARVEEQRIIFETQIQSTTYGEGGTRASGSNNMSSSALLANLDPDSIKVKGEMFLGSYYYSIKINCKGGARCAKYSDVNGTVDQAEITGDYMPSRQSEVVDMVKDIRYLIAR